MTTRLIYILIILPMVLLPLTSNPRPCLAAGRPVAELADLIKSKVTQQGPWAPVAGESVQAPIPLAAFYQKRDFAPAWLGRDQQFKQADELMAVMREVDVAGLTPQHYHLNAIAALLGQIRAAGQTAPPAAEISADLDLLLTDAFFLLGCQLTNGCREPTLSSPNQPADPKPTDAAALLEAALAQQRIKSALLELAPREQIYQKLWQAQARYRDLAAANREWKNIPPGGPSIKPGTADRRIPALRQRLSVLGDLAAQPKTDDELYDVALQKAVLKFQKRHGLEADGAIGAKTFTALNVSPENRLRQIALNLARLRTSFRNPGDRYLLVNIANFSLEVVENGEKRLTMRVIVGKPYQYTPVFHQKLRALVFNPSWGIPRGIAVDEILPKLRKDQGYLDKQQIKVLRNGQLVDGKALRATDWSHLTKNNFPFELRQDPGPKNPLGRIKFLFPNQYDVYLHDSPNKGLFHQNVRAFSHGCIRIEKPVELASYLLSADSRWTGEAINLAIASERQQQIPLPQPIDLYLVYLTAWVDDNNTLQFRDDIYGRDVTVDESLPASHPAATKKNAGTGP